MTWRDKARDTDDNVATIALFISLIGIVFAVVYCVAVVYP